MVIKVPPGTEIYNEDKTVLLTDLTKIDEEDILLKGGNGGLEIIILNHQLTKLQKIYKVN